MRATASTRSTSCVPAKMDLFLTRLHGSLSGVRLHMALDALADRLQALLAEGSIVGSELSSAMRGRLTTLFRVGALTEVKAGGGKRVVLTDAAALRESIQRAYLSFLSGT